MGNRLSDDEIINLAQEYNLPPEIALAIYGQESSSGANTKDSIKGAKGGFQVMPATFKQMGGTDSSDPYQNAEAGIKYLAQGYKKSGTYEGTAAYYHAGPSYAEKLQSNPNLSDGVIKTTDYMQQVAAKARSLKDTVVSKVKDTFTPAPSKEQPTMGMTPSGVDDGSDSPAADYSGPDFPQIVPQPAAVLPPATAATNPAKTPAPDPTEDLMTQAKASLQQMMNASDALTQATTKNLGEQKANAQKEGELNATIGLERFRLESERASANATELSRLGINSSDSDSLIAQLSTSLRENYEESRAMRKNIEDRQNVGILDDPMGYIVNQLALPSLVREHNRKVHDINADEAYLAEAKKVAEDSNQANSLKYASTTAAGAQAAAELARTKAAQDASKIDENLSKVSLDAQVRKMALLDRALSIDNTIQNSKLTREQKQAAIDKAADAKDQQDMQDEKVKTAGRVLGYEVANQKELMKLPKDVREAVQHVAESGEARIATSPLDASNVLRRGDKTRMPPETAQMAGLLEQFRREAEEEVNGDKSVTNPQQKAEAINESMHKKFMDYARNPNKMLQTGTFNPQPSVYKAPDVEVMAKPGTGAEGLKLTKILLEQKKNIPNVPLTDTMITQLAYSAIGQPGGYKDITEAAKDISTYYQSALKVNNSTYHFDSFGLQPQTNYNVQGKDLANFTSVTKIMLEELANEQKTSGFPSLVM